MRLNLYVKIFLSAIIYSIIVQVIHVAVTFATMGYYTDPAYFAVWSKLMMPSMGPPPATFFLYSFAVSFVIGVIFAKVYTKVGKLFSGKSVIRKGLKYGAGLILVSSIPFTLAMILLVNLPLGLILSWLLTDVIVLLLSGIVFAKILG